MLNMKGLVVASTWNGQFDLKQKPEEIRQPDPRQYERDD